MFFLGGVLLIQGCESALDDFDEGHDIPEKRDPRFVQCHYDEDLAKNKCDSVLLSFFGLRAASNLKLNEELSFIGCDENGDLEMLSFGDENCCAPRTFDLVYDLILKEDTLCQIPMMAGSEMKFDFISEDEKTQLAGYVLLFDGQLKFGYPQLKSLLKSKNMDTKIYEIELLRDTLVPNASLNAFYWDVSYLSGNDEMTVTQVNAMTGEYSSIRPITRMGD